MFRHNFFSIIVLIATCWHSQKFCAFDTTDKKNSAEKAIVGAAMYPSYKDFYTFLKPDTPKRTNYDMLDKLITTNDIKQLTNIAPSLASRDIAHAFERIMVTQGSVEAFAALVPFANQKNLHAAFSKSVNAKRKDILEYMIKMGINIDDDIKDMALSDAIQNKSSEIIDLVYPFTPKTNQALSKATRSGDLALVQRMALKADDFDNALCAAMSYSVEMKNTCDCDIDLKSNTTKIIKFLSNQHSSFKKALAYACAMDNKEIFTDLLPKCSDLSVALIISVTTPAIDQSYTRLILDHHKDTIPSDALENMILAILWFDKYHPIRKAQIEQHELHRLLLDQHKDTAPADMLADLVAAIKRFDEDSAQRAQWINQSITKITNPIVLTAIFKVHPDKQQLFTSEQLNAIKLFSSFQKDNGVELLFSHNSSEQDTPTATLLRKYKTHVDDGALKTLCTEINLEQLPYIGYIPKLDHAVSQITAIEQDDQKNDYTTFVHGRNWEWNFVNDVFNIITALKEHKDKIPNTISMRQRDLDSDRLKLYAHRKKLIQSGITGEHLTSCTNDNRDENCKEREEVTFMNYTGLSHLDCLAECSMRYFLQNHSATGGESGYIFAQKLIEKHGLSAYQSYFDALYQAHQAASSHGEMLTISVSNKHIDAIVYPAKVGGYHVGGTTSETVAELKKQIYQPGHVAMKNGTPIFCAAALNIPGEDETMYKIRSVNLADPAKYQQYLEQRDALFEKLKHVTSKRCKISQNDHTYTARPFDALRLQMLRVRPL